MILCRIVDFAVPADHTVKLKESENREKYQDLAREEKRKKLWNIESDGDTNCNWRTRYSHQRLVQGLEDLEITG